MTNFDLNDNTTIPATGFGVFMVPNNGPTEDAVTTALKEGYRLIDTAAAYQNESDVGKGTHNPDNMANAVTLGMYKIH